MADAPQQVLPLLLVVAAVHGCDHRASVRAYQSQFNIDVLRDSSILVLGQRELAEVALTTRGNFLQVPAHWHGYHDLCE